MQYVNFVHGLITVSQTIVGRRPSSYFLDTLTPLYTWRSYYKKGNYSRTVVSVPRPPTLILQHPSNSKRYRLSQGGRGTEALVLLFRYPNTSLHLALLLQKRKL